MGGGLGIGSIYWPAPAPLAPACRPTVPDTAAASSADLSHRLDPAAGDRVLRRLLGAGEAPWLHEEIGRRMAERLAVIRQTPAAVLVWPADDAPLAPGLRAACPGACFERVVEHRAPAEGGRSWWARWRGGEAALPEKTPRQLEAGQAAMLWSVMRLHLDADPRALLAAWRRALAPEGFVMYATLGPGSLPQLRELYARLGWGPALAEPIDMHDLGDMMVEAGFADPVMDQETLRLTYTDPEALLKELRGLGANSAPGRFPGLRTPHWRTRLLTALQGLAGTDGRIPLELEVVYGHAFRAPDRGPAVSADTRIALDDMKSMLRRRPPQG